MQLQPVVSFGEREARRQLVEWVMSVETTSPVVEEIEEVVLEVG